MGNKNRISLSFYTIQSNFKDILIRLSKKIVLLEERVYVNFNDDETKNEVDKFLWTREKNNFIPHKVYGELIKKRDKIILFDGDYMKLKNSQALQSLIIAPCAKIRHFNLFSKFLIFSYSNDNKFNLSMKEKLITNYNINWYDEYIPFKWKQI
jgi:DNA polymerase IIIc chi subunit